MKPKTYSNYFEELGNAVLEPEPLYKMLKGEDLVQVHSHSLNLIIGRDLRQNVRYSCAIALQLANEGQRVLYLNSYARPELLRSSFLSAEQPIEGVILNISDIPLGEYRGKEVAGAVETGHFDVLVLNSLEFAGLTRDNRHKVCRELVKLQKAFNITLVIFSHEIKRDLEPGCASKGALGILTPMAVAISKVGDGWVRYESLPISPLMQERAAAKAAQAAGLS
jgi:hypothetical protein